MKVKRQATRWRINSRVKLQVEGGDPCDCTLNDLSPKGCRLCVEAKLPRNRRFELCLVLSDEHNIKIEAWVAWHKTLEEQEVYGLYFSRINDADREKIYKFMRSDFSEEVNAKWWEGGETNGRRKLRGQKDF